MKLKTALCLLSRPELKELGKLLDVGIFGNQASIAVCFHTCTLLLSKDKIWGERELCMALYPDKDPDSHVKYLRTRTSALLRYVEQYIGWKAYQGDATLQEYCFVTALNQRGWEREYRNAYRHAIAHIEAAPLRGFAHYAMQLDLFDGQIQKESLETLNAKEPIFQSAIDALDNAYAIKKLSLASKAVSQDRLRQTKHRLNFFRDNIIWLQQEALHQSVVARLYGYLFQITAADGSLGESYYFQAKALYFSHSNDWSALGTFENQDILTIFVNYCVRRINEKELQFLAEVADFYELAINMGTLLENGKIEPHHYINAFVAFLRGGNKLALNRLSQRFGNQIKGDVALATKHYCLGYQKLFEQDFESAAQYFLNALNAPPKTKNLIFEAEIRGQAIRASFMSHDYHGAYQQAKVLQVLLRNGRSVNSMRLDAFKAFARFVAALCQAAKSVSSKRLMACKDLELKVKRYGRPFFASGWLDGELARMLGDQGNS